MSKQKEILNMTQNLQDLVKFVNKNIKRNIESNPEEPIDDLLLNLFYVYFSDSDGLEDTENVKDFVSEMKPYFEI